MLIPWFLCGAAVTAAGSYAYFPSSWRKARHWMQRADRLEPNVLYLTFDDGPDPESTPELLDLLAKHRVHATFFVVAAAAKKYPDLLRRMQAEGHQIGFHSNRHRSAYLMTPAQTKADFEAGLASLHSIGIYPKLFRPPWGVVNLASLKQIKDKGLRPVLWDVMAQDWQANITASEIAHRLDKRTWPGAVICLHDGRGALGATARTIQALHIQLPRWEKAGFVFCTLET